MKVQETEAFKQLKAQLREMFQLDRGDLDFGIYRIMNQKREEVTRFLDKQLLPQVREVLESCQSYEDNDIQNELDKLITSLNDAGVDPETSPKVKELRQKLANSVNIDVLEKEIYSDLYNFFKRYYSEGDFISMRRYKEGVYALPYEGEEVKLHWANHDQYYIKTSENLKNYTFKTKTGKRVRFEVVAGGTELNNNKATEGKERRFILHEDAPVEVKYDELVIRFEYRPHEEKKKKQDDLNLEAVEILSNLAEIKAFGLLENAPTEKNKERTLLEKHLTEYTAKNSFDYFIHKDLGKFLSQELDFYIKNEIMHLDDIENETAPKVEAYLAKIKALRKVAGKIIRFLAQLEDFQKKLWLKKKFILETHYCITLDHIIGSDMADELLSIIAANDAQRKEWVKLFAIGELDNYTTPLTVDFLKANDKLLVDTKFFDVEFKYKCLSIFDDLDEQTDGLLINSENFQALNLLQERYKEKVKCIYIDPPYNTGNDGFHYKDSYQHSSWIQMLIDRVTLAHSLMNINSAFFCQISDIELTNLNKLLLKIFGEENFRENIVVVTSSKSGVNAINVKNGERLFKIKEYIQFFSKKPSFRFKYFYTPEKYNYNYRYEIKKQDDRYTIRDLKKYINNESELEKYCLENSKYIFSVEKNNKKAGEKAKLALASNKDRQIVEEYIDGKGNMKLLYDGGVCVPLEERIVYAGNTKSYGVLGSDIWDDIGQAGANEGGVSFDNGKKPLRLLNRIINMADPLIGDIVLDFFAGSGTTGHAVINLNREDGGSRKYILVEMGAYFDSVTKPRILKAVYSKDWKDGKPISREGVSQVIKYMSLEQYEDPLDNLGFNKTEKQQKLLENNPSLNEDYMLGYMLDVESRGSQSLLNIDDFADPFSYSLRITRNDDTQVVNVDLIETLNYLLGLTIRTVDRDKNGIVTLTGKNSFGENCLIIWRNIKEIDNDKLDEWFSKRYSSCDFEFDAIYVNGDNNIENMKLADDHWKVRMIEMEFKRLMFDVQDV